MWTNQKIDRIDNAARKRLNIMGLNTNTIQSREQCSMWKMCAKRSILFDGIDNRIEAIGDELFGSL